MGLALVAKLQAANHRLGRILHALQIPRRTYYNWLCHEKSDRQLENESITLSIRQIWVDNYRVYGYPRMTVALKKLGINISSGRTYRLMKKAGIRSLMSRRFKKPGTHVDYDQRPNLIKALPSKERVWRGDITYIEEKPGTWIYLSSIIDETANQVVARNYNHQMTAELVVSTLNQALQIAPKPEYYHSDMGSQYTSDAFENKLVEHDIKHSYSMKGCPYDNGPMEAFHSILKREFIFQTHFDSLGLE